MYLGWFRSVGVYLFTLSGGAALPRTINDRPYGEGNDFVCERKCVRSLECVGPLSPPYGGAPP